MEDSKILPAGPGFNIPQPDTGSVQAGTSGFVEGWVHSVGGGAWRAGNYLYLRETGKTPLSQKAYDTSYKGIFPYDPKMTTEEAEARLHNYVTDGLREANMSGHGTASFITNVAGSIISPDLFLFGFLPEAKLLNLAANTGKRGSALLAANAARATTRGLVDNVANASLNAGLQNVALEPFVYGLETFAGHDYGLDDSAMNALSGFGLGAVIGAGKTAWRAYAPNTRQALSRAAMRAGLNGETSDPMVGALSGQEPDVNAAARQAHQTAPNMADGSAQRRIAAELRSRKIYDDNIPENARLEGEAAGWEAAANEPGVTPEAARKLRELARDLRLKKTHEEHSANISPEQAYENGRLEREAAAWDAEADKLDVPEDISAMEVPDELPQRTLGPLGNFQEELRKRAYGPEPTDTPRQRAVRRQIRSEITRRNVLDGADRKEATESYSARTKKFRDSARVAASEEEHVLNESFKRIFGTEVSFVDGDVAGDTGLLGLYSPHEPGKIYIRSGSLDGEGINMLRIAGHEMGHVIRARDPELWLSMTDVMLDPSINRHFAASYKEVVSAKKASALWKHMTYHEKMDETLATVLGHAMQSPDFWVSLNKAPGKEGRKLAGYLFKFMDAIEAARIALGRDDTARGKVAPFEKQLAKAFSALESTGLYRFDSKKTAVNEWDRGLNLKGQPLGTDKKPIIFEGYKARRDKFFQMEQDALAPLALKNMKHSRKLEAIDKTLDFLFSDVGNNRGTVRDRSGTGKLVKTYERAAKDPRSLLTASFYGNMDGRALESFNKMLRSITEFYYKKDAWSMESLTSLIHGLKPFYDIYTFNKLLSDLPKRYTKAAAEQNLAEAFDIGPLATYADTGKVDKNGQKIWRIKVYIDDKNPMWSENRKPENFDIDDYERTVRESADSLVDAFNDMEARRAKAVSAVSDQAFENYLKDQRDELVGYLSNLSKDDLKEMSVQDLRDGYTEYLGEQMSRAMANHDEARYDTIVEMVRGKLFRPEAEEGGGARNVKVTTKKRTVEAGKDYANLVDGTQEDYSSPSPAEEADAVKARAAHEKLIQEAWEKAHEQLQKTGKAPEWAEKWEDFDPDKNYHPPEILSGDVKDLGLEGALDVLRSVMFRERIDRMEQTNHPVWVMYTKYMSDAQKADFEDQLRNQIDIAIYGFRPELGRVLKAETQDALMGKAKTPVMTSNAAAIDRASSADAPVKELDTDYAPDWMHDRNTLEEIDWEGMEMPLEETLRLAKDAQGERKAQSDAAVARALNGLKSNLEAFNPWLTDVAQQVQKDLPELLKRNNLIDFEVEDTPLAPGEVRPPPPERTVAEEKLHTTLKGYKKSMRIALADLSDVASGKPRKRGDNAPETDYTKDRFDLHMRLLKGDRWKAVEAAAKDTKDYYNNRIRGEVLSHEASKRIQSKARQSHKVLLSWLDGQARAGVKSPGMNVDSLRKVQAISDITPLDQLLARYGLRDHWKNNSLVQAVLNYIETGTAKTDEVKMIGDTLRQTVDMQAGRINSLGGAYRMLEGYAFSQTHDGAKITANKDAWVQYLSENLDWERTQLFAGKLETPQAKERYLEGVFELVTQRREDVLAAMDEDGGNILNQTALRRTLHLKQGKSFEYDMTFGSGNTGAEIMSQIMRRAEKAAIMDAFGPKYKATWAEATTTLGVQFETKFSDLYNANDTFHQIIGTYDNPVDITMASRGRAMRNLENSAALWMTGISSITDVGNIVSTLRWAGVEPKELHARVLKNIIEAARTEEGRQALQGAGAGMQYFTSAYSRILGGVTWKEVFQGKASFEQWSQKLSDFTFKYSGTELTTRLYQESMMDFMTDHLGSMAGKDSTPEFRNWLEHYDLTADWAAMSKHAGKVEGLEGTRLSPDMITDQKLALKLRAALHDTIAYGQLQPSVSDEALLRMSTRAGTPAGETMRFLGQYKGYPLAVVNKVRARFKYAYGQTDAPIMGIIPTGRGAEEMLAWSASAVVLAWMAIGIKDVLRGNEPLNPLETDHWTWGNATRVLGQAASPMATIEQFMSMQQLLGPVPGAAYRIGKATASDDLGRGYRMTEAVSSALPGASIGPLQEARRQIIGTVFSDAYMTSLERAREFREEVTGQERLLDFND